MRPENVTQAKQRRFGLREIARLFRVPTYMLEASRLRTYLITVAPANPHPLDEGLDLVVQVCAYNREHAMRRVRRHVRGAITNITSARGKR